MSLSEVLQTTNKLSQTIKWKSKMQQSRIINIIRYRIIFDNRAGQLEGVLGTAIKEDQSQITPQLMPALVLSSVSKKTQNTRSQAGQCGPSVLGL